MTLLSISVHPRNGNHRRSTTHMPYGTHWIFRLVHSPDSVWPVFVPLYWHIAFHVYFYHILIQVYAYSCDSSYVSVLRSSIFRTILFSRLKIIDRSDHVLYNHSFLQHFCYIFQIAIGKRCLIQCAFIDTGRINPLHRLFIL